MVYAGEHYRHYHQHDHHDSSYFEYSRKKLIGGKKPRHTAESRKEATRRERLRVKALAQAYLSLQRVIPFDSGTKITYLTVLKGAVAYIKALEMILGIRKDIFSCKKEGKGKIAAETEENIQNKINEDRMVKQEPE